MGLARPARELGPTLHSIQGSYVPRRAQFRLGHERSLIGRLSVLIGLGLLMYVLLLGFQQIWP